jgi:hypothetical protein
MMSVIVKSIILSVIVLIVIMLSVVAPFQYPEEFLKLTIYF